LFWLDIAGGRVLRAAEDGSGMKALVTGHGILAPDGVVVDVAGGKVYWTNMGALTDAAHTPNGSLQRANLDGSGVEVIVPNGATNTPKQMQIDLQHHKIYWADREGARAWRADLDGTNREVLLEGHAIQQLVGMALDVEGGKFYVTDRYAKNILRAGIDLPAGATAANRTDVEVLVQTSGASMPIDLDLDVPHRTMYWTDRGIGTVQRASMDMPAGQTASARKDVVTLESSLATPIGISLDLAAGKMYFTELAGKLYVANLDGTARRALASGGTGVTHVVLPTP
jgi:sugar lactone lactonase YvrE